MLKYKIKVFLIIISLFCTSRGYSQLIGSGLTEDPSRFIESDHPTANTNFRINAISTYTDTLPLPFFEDFTGIVVPIDSIVINTSDNLVRLYDKALNSYGDGTSIYIGYISLPTANSIEDTLGRIPWFITKESNGIFYIDSSTTHRKFFGTTTTIKNAYFRLFKKYYNNTQADTLKWKDGQNTYINNRFPIKPVSYNVATFDGLKSDGIPYNTINVAAVGYTDQLTSHPIKLKTLTISDSIYLSFYWQHSGIGESPEANDFLELQFKDTLNFWNTIQTLSGNISYVDSFKFKSVLVSDPKYLFNGFQFRFRSFGRMSGPYDIWNVDYIYLDKNRTAIDSLEYDISVGNAEVSYLKNYSSMPYGQYFSNKALETGLLDYTINSHSLNVTIPYSTFQFNLKLKYSENTTAYSSTCTGATTFQNFLVGKQLTFSENCYNDFSALPSTSAPILINQEYTIAQTDTTNIFFAANNRYLTSTILWDYYAYDDGTPEWGVAANQIGAQVANTFTTNIIDTLTDIEIYFTRSKGPNMDGRTILLSVWNEAGILLEQQSVQVRYGGFKRYKFATPIIIGANKKFYVGYKQNFVDLLTIGYDKNYDHSDKVFFNLDGTNWVPYNSLAGYTKGSMMIRAIFNKNQLLVTPTIKEVEVENTDVLLYPIPAEEILKIQGKISAISLYDIAGKKLTEKSFDSYEEEKSITISSFPNGIYIAEITINGTIIVKKIIIQHAY